MGETLAETRLAVEAQRAELDQTAAQLREALDIRKRFQENPVPFIAVGATAAFVIVGGPGRVASIVRRRFFPSNPEKAYDTLPKPMQAWVDHMAGALGPWRANDARHALADELVKWRANPRKHGKVSKKLAQQIAEGPPGPTRTVWKTAEVASSLVVAAITKKAIERFLAGEQTASGAIVPVTSGTESSTVTAPVVPPKSGAAKDSKPASYSGITTRERS